MAEQVNTFAEDRRKGLGCSDFAALLVANYDFGGALDVYLDKVEGKSFTGNAATRRGQYFESGVAQFYADETGRHLRKVNPSQDPHLKLAPVGNEWTVVHPEFDFIRGTSDYLTDDPDLGLECKTAHERQLRETASDGGPLWGDEGTDIVPVQYLIQCQGYMGLHQRKRWDLAVHFMGADEFRLYHLDFDPDFYAQMVETGVDFWRNHIIPQIPPPQELIPSERVMGWLLGKALAQGREIQADGDLLNLGLQFAAAQAAKKDAEDLEDAIKAKWAEQMAILGAQKIKGKAPNGANWSIGVQGGGQGKPKIQWNTIALRLALQLGLDGVPETLIRENTIPGNDLTPYVRGYFNAVNKDRKAAQIANLLENLA